MRKPRTRYWAERVDDRVYAVQATRDYGEGFTGTVWVLAGDDAWEDVKAAIDKLFDRRERLIYGIAWSAGWRRRMSERFDWVDRPNGEPNPMEVRPQVEQRAHDRTWVFWEEPRALTP